MKRLKAIEFLTTAAPKSRPDRKIVVETRLEVANIIAEADLKNSLITIIRILAKKRNVKCRIDFRFRRIPLLSIKMRGISISGKR